MDTIEYQRMVENSSAFVDGTFVGIKNNNKTRHLLKRKKYQFVGKKVDNKRNRCYLWKLHLEIHTKYILFCFVYGALFSLDVAVNYRQTMFNCNSKSQSID